MTYNLLNLPASATKGTGADALVSSWTYLADGTKIGAYHSWLEEFDPSIGPGFPEEPAPGPDPDPGSGEVPSGPNALQDPMYAIVEKDYIYAGPFRLVQEMFPASITLESVATVGGRIVKNGNNLQPRYFIADHLGSTRVVLNNAGTVLERYDYYPYGEKIPVTVANTGNTDYLYSGKESQQSLFGINWYDSGARFQTTDGIFTGIDPLAEKYYHISPYAYCAGNPVNVVDPDGEAAHVFVGALVGAMIEGGIAIYQGKSAREVAGAAVRGAIEGGVIAATLGVGTGAALAYGAASSAVGSTVDQAISKGTVDAKTVMFDTVIGTVASVVGGQADKGIKKIATSVNKSIDTKYASSEVSGKIRNEMNREMKNEGKKVSGKELNRLEKERVKNRREAEKAATDFVRDVSRFSTQKNINSITEEICNEAM